MSDGTWSVGIVNTKFDHGIHSFRSGLETAEDADLLLTKIENHFHDNNMDSDSEFHPSRFGVEINRFGHLSCHDRKEMADGSEWNKDDKFRHIAGKKAVSWSNDLTNCGQSLTLKVNKRPDHPDKDTITIRSSEWGTSAKGRHVAKQTLMWLDKTTARNLQKFLNEALG